MEKTHGLSIRHRIRFAGHLGQIFESLGYVQRMSWVWVNKDLAQSIFGIDPIIGVLNFDPYL